jgi:hypothetical protein
MPATDPVARKELASTGTGQADDVLEIRYRRGDSAQRCRIERPARDGQGKDAQDSRRQLEAMRRKVLMRNAVAEQVEDGPEQSCTNRRARSPAAYRSRCDMQGDDQIG